MSSRSVECPKTCDKHRGGKKNYHCYLLKSLDPSHPYKTYIGYTINPQRRIRQHNGDLKNGGARRTRVSGRPWTFALIIHGFQNETSALKFEWAWQHPSRSKIFRSGLPNGSAALAKALESRRGVKARFQLAQILLCESMPYKEEKLTLYFFDEKYKSTFESLFITDSQSDEEDEQDPWCEALPSQTSCKKIDQMEQMPFHLDASQNRKECSKIKSKSEAKRSDDDDSLDDASSSDDQRSKIRSKSKSKKSNDYDSLDVASSSDNEESIVELSGSSIDQVGKDRHLKQNGSVSRDETPHVVIDMTDVYSIDNDTTYTINDTSCCDDTVDLLLSSSIEKRRMSLEDEELNRREEDGLKISVTLSFENTASESLSPNLKELIDSSDTLKAISPEQRHDMLDEGSRCGASDSDQTIDLGDISDLDQTIDLCSP